MGVTKTDYVMVGMVIPEELTKDFDAFDEKFKEYRQGTPEVSPFLITDGGMNSTYRFGIPLSIGDEYDGLTIVSVDFAVLAQTMIQVEHKFQELFGVRRQATLLAFSEWS